MKWSREARGVGGSPLGEGSAQAPERRMSPNRISATCIGEGQEKEYLKWYARSGSVFPRLRGRSARLHLLILLAAKNETFLLFARVGEAIAGPR